MTTASRSARRAPRAAPRARDRAPSSELRPSGRSLRDVIASKMEQAPIERRLTKKQREESDEALENLRAGKARLVGEQDLAGALEELAQLDGHGE